MGYIENNLRKDETVVMQAKFSPLAAAGAFIWMLIFIIAGIAIEVLAVQYTDENVAQIALYVMIVLIVIGLLIFGLRVLSLLMTKLVVTNKRVLGRTGVLSVRTLDIPIEKIDAVNAKATFWGRVFHFYGLTVTSVGGSGMTNARGEEKPFAGIRNAMEFRNCVNDAIEKHADDARKAQAAEIAAAMSAGKM